MSRNLCRCRDRAIGLQGSLSGAFAEPPNPQRLKGSDRNRPEKHPGWFHCFSEIRTVAATFCPEGTYDNSPAFQRWVQGLKNTQAPSGAAETGIPNRSVAPSGLPALCNAKPSVGTLGYSRLSLRDKSLLNVRKALSDEPKGGLVAPLPQSTSCGAGWWLGPVLIRQCGFKAIYLDALCAVGANPDIVDFQGMEELPNSFLKPLPSFFPHLHRIIANCPADSRPFSPTSLCRRCRTGYRACPPPPRSGRDASLRQFARQTGASPRQRDPADCNLFVIVEHQKAPKVGDETARLYRFA